MTNNTQDTLARALAVLRSSYAAWQRAGSPVAGSVADRLGVAEDRLEAAYSSFFSAGGTREQADALEDMIL